MNPLDEDQPVLTAKELLAHRRASGVLPDFDPPRAVIFAPQRSLARYVLRRHPVKRVRGFLGEFHLLKRSQGRVALSTGFGIGAPVIAGLADEFAALGVSQFVLIGMAGGLQPGVETGSLIIATEAIRGEGVSNHYLPAARTAKSSSKISGGLSRMLTKNGQLHVSGLTWTTDAPFREIRRAVLQHQKEGVLAVDMEAAALLAVAEANDVSAAAVFSIADTLVDGRWQMDTDLRPAQKGLGLLFDAVFEYLTAMA